MEQPATSKPVTRLTRVYEDLVEKLSDVVEVEGTTSAEFLDPLIRSHIESRYNANIVAINALREARRAARKDRDTEPAFANELGGEGA